MSKHKTITKASGETETFDIDKLELSLVKSGASKSLAKEIRKKIEGHVVDGMSSYDIFKSAYRLLQEQNTILASKYSIKQAVYQLGPEGFPFERFVAKILERQGYETKVGVMVEGMCVSHEVDVDARKGSGHVFIECKFHNSGTIKTDTQTALYVKARFDDIQGRLRRIKGQKGLFRQAWIVTNTKCTSQAIKYAECNNMKIISWDHPEGGSLQEMIEKSGLHPITCLNLIRRQHRRMLLDKGLVLCREVQENEDLLEGLGIKGKYKEAVIQEAKAVCI